MASMSRSKASMGRIAIILVLLVSVTGAGYEAWQHFGAHAGKVAYRTAVVKPLNLVSSITATGTVVPEESIDVGAQVNGLIASFGTDADGKLVDYGSKVNRGTILARIDDTLYAASAAAAEAGLGQAKAQLAVNQANVSAAQAKLDQARKDWARAQKLGPSTSLSQADYDMYQSNYEQAVAGVDQAKASVLLAQASVAVADATYKSAKQNLDYCTITSAVKGVIIDRRVEIGQTVVSSLSAPSLFLLAKDLTKMLVLVQTNEADVGHVHPGDTVTFTADAFPGETFRGEVRKIRLNATQTQNVVTYTSEIVTDNRSLKLLPYLTTNVTFVVARKENVLAVPNAALRWAPRSHGHPGHDSTAPSGERRAGAGPVGEKGEKSDKKAELSTLWVLGSEEEGIRPVKVRAGISDGTFTEVSANGLQEGDHVVVDEAVPGTPGTTTTNPFAPRLTGGRR